MFAPRIALVLLLALSSGWCQSSVPPSISRSVSLPKEIEPRPVYPFRSGCARDGSFLVPLAGGLEQTGLPLLRISAQGTVLGRIDPEAAADLGRIRVSDYALAPGAEVYVLARKISRLDVERNEKGLVIRRSEMTGPGLWFLSFNAQGELTEKRELNGPAYSPHGGIAPAPDGSVFITTSKFRSPPYSGSRPPPLEPVRPTRVPLGYFLAPGGQPRPVELPPLEEGFTSAHAWIDEPVMHGQEIWLVRFGRAGSSSMLHVLRADGSLERSVLLELPAGFEAGSPQAWGDRLLIQVHSSRTNFIRGSRFVELDAHTGKPLADYTFPTTRVTAVCYSAEGPVFLDAGKQVLGFASPR